MSRMIECTVIEPPTGGEVLARALANISAGEFELVLLPATEVPRPKPQPIVLRLRTHSMGTIDEYSHVLSGEVIQPDDMATATVRIPHDAGEPAQATIVTL